MWQCWNPNDFSIHPSIFTYEQVAVLNTKLNKMQSPTLQLFRNTGKKLKRVNAKSPSITYSKRGPLVLMALALLTTANCNLSFRSNMH